MTRYTGKNKVKTAIFVSGSGTNLKNLIKFSKKINSPISINLVISNNLKSKGFLFAKKNKISTVFYSFNNDKNYEILLSKLIDLNIKLICLAGFMKIIPKSFLKNFKGKILNIHPSLLPKYKGLNTHGRALKNKEKYVGCTVHFVSNKLDSGKIIIQKKTRLLKKDTITTIKKRVLKLEHKIYPIAIKKILL
tara:strand:+ start:56 stop:631 length:576 start_codon:yes stop_codon:yes gene_type:complete